MSFNEEQSLIVLEPHALKNMQQKYVKEKKIEGKMHCQHIFRIVEGHGLPACTQDLEACTEAKNASSDFQVVAFFTAAPSRKLYASNKYHKSLNSYSHEMNLC